MRSGRVMGDSASFAQQLKASGAGRSHPRIFLGAYAAMPPKGSGNSVSELTAFFESVRSLPEVGGLELPFFQEGLFPAGVPHPVDQLADGWEFMVTALPCQMETMASDPEFGLASENADGRARAMDAVDRLFEQVKELLKARPDARLRAIEIHSGPRPNRSNESSREALVRSLEELRRRDPILFPKLVVEHCDGFGASDKVAKGFLKIEDELSAISEFDLGLIVNWGRSVIETRRVSGPVEHLQKAGGRLRGLIFSGASSAHPLYGEWLDSHAPFQEAFDLPELLLLSAGAAKSSLLEARRQVSRDEMILGLKMQPLPLSLAAAERIGFLKRNLSILTRVCSEI